MQLAKTSLGVVLALPQGQHSFHVRCVKNDVLLPLLDVFDLLDRSVHLESLSPPTHLGRGTGKNGSPLSRRVRGYNRHRGEPVASCTRISWQVSLVSPQSSRAAVILVQDSCRNSFAPTTSLTMDTGLKIEGEPLTVNASGSEEMLLRPCVDCGLVTGSYCDHCLAVDRCPAEEWAKGQMTPLCTLCDDKSKACHFCRGMAWCTPPPRHNTLPQRMVHLKVDPA